LHSFPVAAAISVAAAASNAHCVIALAASALAALIATNFFA
jgi:hypothetical protein